MSKEHYEIDLEMMMDFIDESLESFEPIPSLFVAFEQDPEDQTKIESIFRPVHSLKGNAAYFGLIRIKNLAHDLESVLDLMRKGKLMPSSDIIDGLLSGIDQMQVILEQTRENATETVDDQVYNAVLDRVRALTGEDDLVQDQQELQEADTWLEIWDEVVQLRKMPNCQEEHVARQVDKILEMLAKAAPGIGDAEEVVALEVSAGSPLAALMELLEDGALAPAQKGERVRLVLSHLQDRCEQDEARAILDNAVEEFDLFVSKIGYDPMLEDSLLETAQKLATLQDWGSREDIEGEVETEHPPSEETVVAEEAPAEPAPAVPEPVAEPLPAQPAAVGRVNGEAAPAKSPERAAREGGRTMRVSEDAIDGFLGYVGELIALDEMFRYIHGEMVKNDTDLTRGTDLLRTINTFTKLSDDLQASIMNIRKVSVKPMLSKTQRIVRDIAAVSGKEIQVALEGEETSIDRSLIETLEAPMVHMVRNAADHGVEEPGERVAAGKDRVGEIRVGIRENEEDLFLSIRDNGRGFNYDKIRNKAERMGLLRPGDPINERRLADIVFSPGFSTAEQVTDISGRGVGMDAVKRAVEDAGGSIKIFSEPGQGTEFLIQLPKTIGTQIISSFVVQLDNQRFVLPMDKVSGSFKAEADKVHSLPNGAACVKRNDSVLPVVCLDGPYMGDPQLLSEGILITIESDPRFVFYVDSILGMQKVVVRGVPWMRAEKFLGAAVMGDGRVSMILNTESLIPYALGEGA